MAFSGKVCPHIQGISYTRDNILPPMKQMQGMYAVIVNDWELAGMWLQSGSIPVLRIKTPQYWDDDGDKNIPNVEAYADHVCNLLDAAELYAPPELKGKGVGHLGNELFTELPTRTDTWLARGIRRFAARGRKCVVGNWAYLNRPKLDKMPLTIQALRDTGSWMGYHEGLYGDVWRAEDAIASGAIGGFRAEQARYGFRVLITEFAASVTPHEGWQAMFVNRGGYKAWAAQIRKSLELALEGADALCLYSMPPWNEGRGFDYDNPDPQSDEYKLRDELALINRDFPVKEQPVTQPIPAPTEGGVLSTLTTIPGVYINVRPQPNSATDSGDLLKGDVVKAYPPVNGWVYVEPITPVARPEGRQPAVKGWVSLQNGAVVFTAVPPPTVKQYTFTEAQMTELRRLAKQQDDTNAAIVDILDSAEVAVPNVGNPF